MKRIGWVGPFTAVALFALLYLPVFRHWLPESGWARLPFSPQAFFLLASWIILRVRRIGWGELGLAGPRSVSRVGLGFTLGIIPAVLALAIGGILTWLNTRVSFLPMPIFGGTPFENGIETYDLVTLLLLAPVCEEIFFRGILLRSLRETNPAWLSVIASALIFMGGHGPLAAGPLVLGLINGVIFLRTGSVLPGIVFHSIANGYGPAMIAWFPNLYRYLAFLY